MKDEVTKEDEEQFLKALDGHKCEVCHEYKDDVEYCADPYAEDVGGQIVMTYLCVECYNELVMDI